MTVFDHHLYDHPVKNVMYSLGAERSIVDGGSLHRVERGHPYFRRGAMVKVIPQFRALNLFSPTSENSALPAKAVSSTRISYPVAAK